MTWIKGGRQTLNSPLPETTIQGKISHSALLKVQQLRKYFPLKRGIVIGKKKSVVKAVDDISFEIKRGETFGLVGESGCGKSTTGRVILRLYEPTAGKVFFDDVDITSLNKKELQHYRSRMQMIFQDSYNSLNPRHSIGDIIGEPLGIYRKMSKADIHFRVQELLELVGY